MLDPADYQRLQIGQPEPDVAAVLPARTRVDNPEGTSPTPDGARCRYYSTRANPFDDELFRLCFLDGRLVEKALIERDHDGGR